MGAGQGTDFWSRRRAAVKAESDAETQMQRAADAAEETTARDAELADKTDAEILSELGLKDPDTLQRGDDFSAFMKSAVPDHLRGKALRRLWRSNPVLANVDNLVDYGHDFTDSATVISDLKTAYQVGRGMMKHVAALAETFDAPAGDAIEPVNEPIQEIQEVSEPDVAEVAHTAETEPANCAAPKPRHMRFSFADATPEVLS